MNSRDIIVLIFPLIIVQLGLQIAALVSMIKRDVGQIRWNNKIIWALIIVFGEVIGPIVYFVFGRIEGDLDAGSGD